METSMVELMLGTCIAFYTALCHLEAPVPRKLRTLQSTTELLLGSGDVFFPYLTLFLKFKRKLCL